MNSIIYKRINIYELPDGYYSTDIVTPMTRIADCHSAIGILIGKLTSFSDFDTIIYNNTNASKGEVYRFERLFYFIKKNCNSDLLAAVQESCEYVITHSANFFKNEKNAIILLNWIIYGIVIIACIILIPYIYKTQRVIIEIMILFMKIDKAEIRRKIDDYEKLAQKINNHFDKIRNEFWKTKFTIEK